MLAPRPRVTDGGLPERPAKGGDHDASGGTVEAVRAAMAGAGIDALVLRPSPDFRFLGGTGDAFLVLTRDGLPVETADPAAFVPAGAVRVGVDPELRVRELFGLRVDAELVPATAVLAPLRLRKQPHEIHAIERAARAAQAVLTAAADLPWFGATEQAMARRLRVLATESGCEELISVLVAAGEHTAVPGHRPGERVINPGDALQVSVCGRWDGYCAEVARVFAVAEPPEDFEPMYSVVLTAHDAALDAVRRGNPAELVARAVREVVDGSGYGGYVTDGAGRGVGLGHDEGPWLHPGDTTALEPGMTICVEPAIYVPDLFGARLADVVACTQDGPAPLTTSPPTLHVLDR